MGSVSDLLSGAAGQIGRYFSVLSVLSSALLVTYVFALAASGAWDGSPDWDKTASALSNPKLGTIAELVLVSLLVGLVLQPLQYALIQLLEGYWGVGVPAVAAMTWRTRRHRAQRLHLHRLQGNALHVLDDAGRNPTDGKSVPNALLAHLVVYDEADRLLTRYPVRKNDVRATRLGNVLRRYEMLAGSQYRLSAPVVVPHIAHVAPANEVAYLNDQRTNLDLAVRMVAVSAVATLASVLFLWRAGPWLLIGLAPYLVMYASYRGAIVVAATYGAAFSNLIDLNRFALYERLGIPRPPDTAAERAQNEKLMDLLRADKGAGATYAPTDPPDTSAP